MSAAVDPLDPNGSANEHLCNIFTEKNELLYCMITHSDAVRVIEERQAMPERYPLWQGDLIIKCLAPQQDKPKSSPAPQRKLTPDVLPAFLAGTDHPKFCLQGHNLALGDNEVFFDVSCGEWRGIIRLEEALFNIDRFTEEEQRRILQVLPYHFDMPDHDCVVTSKEATH